MTRKIFRDIALERVQSPEQLGRLIRVVQPANWLALTMVALILATGVAWGFLGTIPHQVAARGILIHRDGVRDIVSMGAGQISDIFIRTGDVVSRGQVVGRIDMTLLEKDIRDARAEWEETTKYHSHLETFHATHLNIQLENLETKKKNLRIAAKSLKKQCAFFKIQSERESSLGKEGILPLKAVAETREKFNHATNELNRIYLEQDDTKAELQKLRSEAKRELMDSRHKMNGLLRKMKSLEARLGLESVIRSEYEGRVVEIKIGAGTAVACGTPVMTVEPLNRKLVAQLYISPSEGKKIRPGMEVEISPSTVKRDEFGGILGLVTTVSEYPATREGMLRILGGNTVLVESLSGEKAPIVISADLLPAADMPSGYHWSSSRGPEFPIETGTLCSGVVTVERKRPISFLMPYFKKICGV